MNDGRHRRNDSRRIGMQVHSTGALSTKLKPFVVSISSICLLCCIHCARESYHFEAGISGPQIGNCVMLKVSKVKVNVDLYSASS